MASIPVKPTPGPQPKKTLDERFRQLATIWHRETDYLSSMSDASRHPAYQEIIALGPDVVPLLLRDLEENHSHWFSALRTITEATPVPASAAGDIPKMVEAWLNWARSNGYRW